MGCFISLPSQALQLKAVTVIELSSRGHNLFLPRVPAGWPDLQALLAHFYWWALITFWHNTCHLWKMN